MLTPHLIWSRENCKRLNQPPIIVYIPRRVAEKRWAKAGDWIQLRKSAETKTILTSVPQDIGVSVLVLDHRKAYRIYDDEGYTG